MRPLLTKPGFRTQKGYLNLLYNWWRGAPHITVLGLHEPTPMQRLARRLGLYNEDLRVELAKVLYGEAQLGRWN